MVEALVARPLICVVYSPIDARYITECNAQFVYTLFFVLTSNKW